LWANAFDVAGRLEANDGAIGHLHIAVDDAAAKLAARSYACTR
jgi:hypothetical protein